MEWDPGPSETSRSVRRVRHDDGWPDPFDAADSHQRQNPEPEPCGRTVRQDPVPAPRARMDARAIIDGLDGTERETT
jgi:hypothetical protein